MVVSKKFLLMQKNNDD